MRRIALALCFLAVVAGVSAIETSEDTDFRDTQWGTSSTEVYDQVSLSMAGSGYDHIAYEHTLFDESVIVTYEFDDERLTGGKYEFMPWPSSYTGLFAACREALAERHGEPTDQRFVYHGQSWPSLSERDLENVLTEGKLELIAEWETARSTIELYAGQSSEWFPPLVTLRYAVREER